MLRLAWPFILSNGCWTLQLAFNRLLLSRAGCAEVGAATVGTMLYWPPVCLLSNVAGYASIFVAQYVGAGDTRFVTAAALGLSWAVMVLPSWVAWHYGGGLYWSRAFARPCSANRWALAGCLSPSIASAALPENRRSDGARPISPSNTRWAWSTSPRLA